MCVLSILQVVFDIGLMLVLNLEFKIDSMVVLLVMVLSIGMLAGIDLMSPLHTMKTGFDNTLRELAIIVVFGAVVNKLMVDSGAVHQIAYTLLVRFGLRYVQISVTIIRLISGLAMFYEVVFIILAPLVIVIAIEAKTLLLKLITPAATAATTAHSLFPPQPGPVALVNAYDVDMGMAYIYSILVTTPSVICTGLILPRFFGNFGRPTSSFLKADQPVDMNNLPSFGASILMPLISAIITISATTANIWLVKDTPTQEVVNLTGSSSIAIFIAMMVAFILFGTACGHDMQWVVNAFESTTENITMVTLIIGAGGVLKQAITDTGVGDIIGMLTSHDNISPYIVAWLTTALIRLVTGQGVISAMTAARIISAAILDSATGQLVGANPALLVPATAASFNTLIRTNGASFWLFKGYSDLSVKDTLRAWGLLELVNSVVGLIIVLIIDTVA